MTFPYSRVRPTGHWLDYPDTTYGVVNAAGLEQWDAAIDELKRVIVTWPAPSGDTSGATDLAAVQALLNVSLPAGTTGVMHLIPPGVYYFNAHLAINYTTKLVGAGVGSLDHLLSSATQLIFTSATDDGLKSFAGGCTFEDFAVINNNGSESAGAGINLPFAGYMTMNRVGISGFYDNARIDTGIYWQLNSCYFLKAVRYGLRIQNTDVADAGDGFIGSGCVFYPRSTGATAAIRWETGGGLKVEGVKINQNGSGKWSYGIDAAIADGQSTSVMLVEGASIEGVSTTGVNIRQQGTTGLFGKIILNGIEFGPAGSMPTCVSAVATTANDISSVTVTNNYMSATTDAVYLEGISGGYVGGNDIEGTFSDAAIALKQVTNVTVAPNLIVGSFTNAAVLIKSSGTPSTGVVVDHQGITTTSSSQTLVQDNSAAVVAHVARNRIVYDEVREIPGGFTTTYTTMYQFLLPPNVGVGGVLTFTIEGLIAGGTSPDGFVIHGKRLLYCPKAASSNVTATIIGTDATAGTTVDYQILCTTAASAYLQIRINATQAGTTITGQVAVKYDGPLARIVKA